MKADMNNSYQAHARAYRHMGSTRPNTASVASSTRYTCPMHPEIVRDAPGICPKCGMTLVPIASAGGSETDNAELRDLTRRLWVGVALSRATMHNIRQNLAFAFGYNALGIPVAAEQPSARSRGHNRLALMTPHLIWRTTWQ